MDGLYANVTSCVWGNTDFPVCHIPFLLPLKILDLCFLLQFILNFLVFLLASSHITGKNFSNVPSRSLVVFNIQYIQLPPLYSYPHQLDLLPLKHFTQSTEFLMIFLEVAFAFIFSKTTTYIQKILLSLRPYAHQEYLTWTHFLDNYKYITPYQKNVLPRL